MVDVGTIGSLPCEVSMSIILRELNDPKMTRKITKLLLYVRKTLKELRSINHKPTYLYLRTLCWDDTKKSVERITGVRVSGVPTTNAIASHAMCCIHAYFGREAEYLKTLK